MNQIITIGREFGSGGRELGKKLAEELGFAYYDHEIIAEIAKRTNLAQEYVRSLIDHKPAFRFPITIGQTLHAPVPDYFADQQGAIYAQQTDVIREMANKSDCVIVGRCADYILRDLHPLRVFVYANLPERIERCRRYSVEQEMLSNSALKQQILSIDKERARYYQNYTGQKWGVRENYDVLVNTSHVTTSEAVTALAALMRKRREN